MSTNNPGEIRNDNWQALRERVSGLRGEVHAALLQAGPCTTRELAAKAGLSILTVRPRVTELVELGFAECTGRAAGEGIYRALTHAEAAGLFHAARELARGDGVQLAMRL